MKFKIALKRVLYTTLRVACWIGALVAEVFCGFAIWMLLSGDVMVPGMEMFVTLGYLMALFVLGAAMSWFAFSMYYLHYRPTHTHAKALTALSIITLALLLPTCYFHIVGAFDLDAITVPFVRVIGVLLSIIIPISSITICYYVLKHALQQLNETHK